MPYTKRFMTTDENGIHLGPDAGKVDLVPDHKIIHKISGEDTGGFLSVEVDTHSS